MAIGKKIECRRCENLKSIRTQKCHFKSHAEFFSRQKISLPTIQIYILVILNIKVESTDSFCTGNITANTCVDIECPIFDKRIH